ncbi:DUF6221 family protein [Nocardiopsis sp. FR26]|uniref:DUF6221 family protein n=1 Tax=Nocardiopsis sp. FR26 TaxID=2605987 RepID=UPI0013589408|nr:DUF6221 family protein [Nocardiopsis sp. FR26]
MSDLSLPDFLRARFEEEKVAAVATRDAGGEGAAGWVHDEENGALDFGLPNRTLYSTPIGTFAAELEHAARYDPDRILREVNAKLRIVEMCDATERAHRNSTAGDLARTVLDQLAAPYRSHPDYPGTAAR